MGCDINLYVETRTADGWREVTPEEVGLPPEEDEAEFGRDCGGFYGERSYRFFSILADVRNSEGLKPIAPARGFPTHLSPRLAQMVAEDNFDFGDHSFSWVDLEELLVYDWTAAGVARPDGLPHGRLGLVIDALRVLPGGARLVFGFDS